MYLALREMRYAKLRFALIVTIMLLVSFLVLFVTGLARGLAYDTTSALETMKADHFILEQGSEQRFGRSILSENQLDEAKNALGADNVTPLSVRMTTVSNQDGVKKDVALFIVDSDSWLMPNVMEGNSLPGEASGQVLADKKLKSSGVELGSIVKDQATGLTWTVSGFVDQSSYSHQPVLFLNEKEGAKLLDASGTQASGDEGKVNYNVIAVKATADQAAKLADQVPGTEVITKGDAISAIPGYSEEQGSLNMMIAFLYVIAAFVLAVFFYVMTIQKTSQFGILKAIGARTKVLASGLIIQVLLLSVGSMGISLLLVRMMMQALPDTMPFRLSATTMGLTSVGFVLVAILGSLLSVGKVARTDALEAMGRVAG
ncbi:ABC transporter permease [Gorillibacterium timonense]|uniref:ABC transporter permease n=1 Tax=Gorillibacterium timonense TaxID=1689269 RepID=UPI00071E2905|nr:ABC transporter permease [Gorillibacterium timonense]